MTSIKTIILTLFVPLIMPICGHHNILKSFLFFFFLSKNSKSFIDEKMLLSVI